MRQGDLAIMHQLSGRPISANPEYPVHRAHKEKSATDAAFKAEQEKSRREEAITQATGLRVLKATSDAVPVRLMKRDLLFVAKLLTAFLCKADESTLGRVLVAIAVLQSAQGPNESAKALRDAAEFYKVDVAAITTKVKQDFAAKEKAQAAKKTAAKERPGQQRTVTAKKAKAA